MRAATGNKGSIYYIYDATGNKLEKITRDTAGSLVTTTTYIGGFQYQGKRALSDGNLPADTLQFFGHEEGRVRVNTDTTGGQQLTSFKYDYFLKDHLGNTRIVLTDEKETDMYPAATMEVADSAIEGLYYSKLADTRVLLPAGYPTDTTTKPNNYVTKVGGATGPKIGPGITLKVMAGDQFNIRVSSWYKLNGTSPGTPANPVTDLVSALIAGVSGLPGGAHPSAATLAANSTVLSDNVTQFLSDTAGGTTSGRPLAFVNWVLFDNQFNYVAESSGFQQVGADNTLTAINKLQLPVTKSGYLYIYLSNETQNVDVFFDNLQVTHVRGPMLEEDHYYPFGVAMGGISDKTLKSQYADNKYRYNKGSELQNEEFSDGSGLEMYETHLRELDPQLGKWLQIDPVFASGIDGNDEVNGVIIEGLKSQSPFASMDNNPIRLDDPNGDCAPCVVPLVEGGVALTEVLMGASVTTTIALSPYASGPIGNSSFGASSFADIAEQNAEAARNTKMTLSPSDQVALNKFNKLQGLSSVDVVKTEGKTFNGKQDTQSGTQKEAFNKAKDQNGIPRTAQPDKTIKVDEVSKGKPTGKKLREYQYTNSKGEKVSIRKDNKTTYSEGGVGDQGDHYNAGQTGGKLKQHHNYGKQ
jgi:hypothetical protein